MNQQPGRRRGNHDDDDDDDNGTIGYFDLERLVRYSGLSLSTLRRYLKVPVDPLPHLVVRSPGRATGRGRIVVRRDEFDAWMARTFAPPAPATPGKPDVSWIRRAYDEA